MGRSSSSDASTPCAGEEGRALRRAPARQQRLQWVALGASADAAAVGYEAPPCLPGVHVAAQPTVRPLARRQLQNTSLEMTSSFFWSSPCVHGVGSGTVSVEAQWSREQWGPCPLCVPCMRMHGSRQNARMARMRVRKRAPPPPRACTHGEVLAALRAGEVGDAGAADKGGNLLARQGDGRNHGGQLAVQRALLLLLRVWVCGFVSVWGGWAGCGPHHTGCPAPMHASRMGFLILAGIPTPPSTPTHPPSAARS